VLHLKISEEFNDRSYLSSITFILQGTRIELIGFVINGFCTNDIKHK
jgi:hypothetical protein